MLPPSLNFIRYNLRTESWPFSRVGHHNILAVPLHWSQAVVQQTGGDIRIRLNVVPTPDLENTFRKFGDASWE